MGKVLVIKGADFSANAIGSIYFNMDMVQGVINSANAYFGMWDPVSTEAANRIKTAKTAGVKIAAAGTLELNVPTGLDYFMFCYNSSVPGTDTVVKSKSSVSWTAVTGGKITIQNTDNADRWYFISLRWNGTDGVHAANADITPSDVDITYL